MIVREPMLILNEIEKEQKKLIKIRMEAMNIESKINNLQRELAVATRG